MQKIRDWRLNAPRNYRWTDDEVLSEKTQSFFNGVIVGAILSSIVLLILQAIT